MTQWYKSGQDLIDTLHAQKADQNLIAITRLGQCGQAIAGQGTLLLIDPVLTDLKDAQGNTRRLYPAPFHPGNLHADYVLCTHAHRDHFAADTLQALRKANPALKLIIPAALKEQAQALGFLKENLVLMEDGQSTALSDDLSISAIRTAHPVEQKDEKGRDTNLAYDVQLGGHRFLHLGDTYLSEGLLERLQSHAKPDVLFAPINGQDYFRTTRNCIGNLSDYEAVRLAVLLEAGLVIPMHYDMMTGNTSSPVGFVENMLEICPQRPFALPRLGESILIRRCV